MQKKIIALAIAGLASTAAFAQSNVTVYGVADVYYGNGSASGKETRTSINSSGLSGSRIGFKGTEDLGNGLKALFTLEYGIAVDGNTGVGSAGTTSSTTARQQFVGVTGGFGTVLGGRLQTAGYDFSAVSNTFHGSAINPLASVQGGFAAGPTLNGQGAGFSLIGQSSRASNAVAYVSPTLFGGLVLAYNHARLSETATTGTTSDNTANLYSATYTAGPAVVSAVVANAGLNNALVTGAPHLNEWAIGGGYDFGVVNLKGSYQSSKLDGTSGNDKAWQVSALVPVTAAGKINFGYAKLKKGSTTASDDASSWTLAYLHSLSKRTTLYTGYQRVSNSGTQTLGTALADTPTAGSSARGFVAGVNHSF
ncbi:MAG TPA: porin [Rhodocyclaceae bacterium]|jgi:predicted porin